MAAEVETGYFIISPKPLPVRQVGEDGDVNVINQQVFPYAPTEERADGFSVTTAVQAKAALTGKYRRELGMSVGGVRIVRRLEAIAFVQAQKAASAAQGPRG